MKPCAPMCCPEVCNSRRSDARMKPGLLPVQPAVMKKRAASPCAARMGRASVRFERWPSSNVICGCKVPAGRAEEKRATCSLKAEVLVT